MLGSALKCVVEVRPAQGCDYVTDTLSQLVLEIHCRFQVSECIIASLYSARPMFTWHCNCQPHGPVHQYFSLVTCNDCTTYYFSSKNKNSCNPCYSQRCIIAQLLSLGDVAQLTWGTDDIML